MEEAGERHTGGGGGGGIHVLDVLRLNREEWTGCYATRNIKHTHTHTHTHTHKEKHTHRHTHTQTR